MSTRVPPSALARWSRARAPRAARCVALDARLSLHDRATFAISSGAASAWQLHAVKCRRSQSRRTDLPVV